MTVLADLAAGRDPLARSPVDLGRALQTFGIAVEKPKGGSHWKAVGPGGVTYPIPAHNGQKPEVADV